MLYNLLFLLPPEIAHSLTIMALKRIPYRKPIELPESLSIDFFGNSIRSPIGLAAGFDKNAEVIKPMMSLGFGFVEVGTVTLNPQYGNKKPRIFRLIKDKGIINRLGFNNKGIEYLLKQISRAELGNCVFGINIGKNSTSEDLISDYVSLMKKVYGKSNYIVLNISSPNTLNLRKLHNKQELLQLLQAVRGSIIPIILKISPDIDQQTKEDIAELVLEYKIDGIIISNTTVYRDNLYFNQNEFGGLSGKPLFNLSTKLLGDMYKLTSGKILLIGCGGVSSGTDAYEKIKAGASLVQLYTALVYHGPQIVNKINMELAELIKRDGFANISEAVGCSFK